MELYIFDRGLNLLGILEGFFSLRWVRRYSKCGEFELHCGLTPETVSLLQRGNIVWKRDDHEAGYIEHRNLKQELDGKETLAVKGKFLTGYLSRRIIWGMENFNTTAENAIRELINKNVINPTNANRKINILALGTMKGYSGGITLQVSYRNLLETVEEIATTNELGIRTLIDVSNKKIIFDIYKGLDRTADNGINPPVIFSREFENILEQEYTDSLNNYRNTALIAGAGEGIDRELVAIESGQGLDRYELFVDARDLQDKDEDNSPIPLVDYRGMLAERGRAKLAETREVLTFESKVNLHSNLKYKHDFDLGDIVTCMSKKWGITVDTRITEVEEVYEESGFDVNITFGNSIPTLIDKIKQVVN